MERNAKRRNEARNFGLVVRAEWSAGPRTSAWDRLWRIILSEVDPALSAGTVQQIGREGDDG